jgi:hypothetical protein
VSAPSTLSITGFPFKLSPHSAVTANGEETGANIYIFPAYAGLNGSFASFSGSTASVRVGGPAGVLVCISLQRTGNTLSSVMLGGAGISVSQQCSPSAASLFPNAFSAPFCSSLPNTTNAPYISSVLGVYTLQSGGSSGASSSAIALSAAFLAAGFVALLI